MLFTSLPPFVFVIAAAVAGLGAYAIRATPLASSLLAILCAVLVVAAWVRARREKMVELHDPAISTLVFPPESRFR